jgi:hypothetical protein
MSSDQPPKIIVDDDWKSRVESEREKLREDCDSGAEAAPRSQGETSPRGDPRRQRQPASLPPASFPLLVSTLATEALASLGQFPRSEHEPPRVVLNHAKHFIDTLAILQDKTAGNLTPDEAKMLEDVVHELRMAYVAVSSRQGDSGPRPK